MYPTPTSLAAALLAAVVAFGVNAQEKAAPKKAEAKAAAPAPAAQPRLVVNGVTIPQSRVELLNKELSANGQADSPERAAAIKDLDRRADAYQGMHGEPVDGQDVFAVREATERALGICRKESRPALLEIRTYRFMGHSMSDAVSGTYRTKAELDEQLKRDPVLMLKARMLETGDCTEADVAEMEREIKALCQDAWDFADASPEPSAEALYEDVLVDTVS